MIKFLVPNTNDFMIIYKNSLAESILSLFLMDLLTSFTRFLKNAGSILTYDLLLLLFFKFYFKAYRTEEGKPWVLPVVKKAEKAVVDDPTLNHEYLPVLGMESFSNAATGLLLGEDSSKIKNGQAFGVQTLSGTGALRVGAEFLAQVMNRRVFYYSDPTWENHLSVFLSAGFTDGRAYKYWNPTTRGVDFGKNF